MVVWSAIDVIKRVSATCGISARRVGDDHMERRDGDSAISGVFDSCVV